MTEENKKIQDDQLTIINYIHSLHSFLNSSCSELEFRVHAIKREIMDMKSWLLMQPNKSDFIQKKISELKGVY